MERVARSAFLTESNDAVSALSPQEMMMTDTLETTRTFRVHARHVDVHHARTVQEPSFEAAAVAYVEHLHVLPEDDGEISVVVRDIDTGHEHSFSVRLDSGETTVRS